MAGVSSCLASEADEIVEVEVVEGAAQVFAGGVEALDLFGVPLAHFDIVKGDGVRPVGPLADFQRRVFERRVFVDPGQDVPVAGTGGDLLLQGGGIDAGETEEVPVVGVLVFVFAGGSGEFRADLVEDARQDGVAAEADAGAARWTWVRSGAFMVMDEC